MPIPIGTKVTPAKGHLFEGWPAIVITNDFQPYQNGIKIDHPLVPKTYGFNDSELEIIEETKNATEHSSHD